MHDFSIRNQQCSNQGCAFVGQVAAGNVVVHSRKQRRFRCTACRRTWVNRVGSFYYRLHVEPERVEHALRMLANGVPIREVAKLCKASPTTVHRWKMRQLRLNRSFNLNQYECLS